MPNMIQWESLKRAASVLFLSAFFLTGCARDSRLEEINHQQSATIDALNQEIAKLNQELESLSQNRQSLLQAKEDLQSHLKSEVKSGDLSLSVQSKGLVITVSDRILFESGKAVLKSDSLATLEKISQTLAALSASHKIYIEGHTDNDPIRYSNWRSNWELSSARAMEVLHFFVEDQKLNPAQFGATGFGEFQPVANNNSDDGKMKNRRVEIVVT